MSSASTSSPSAVSPSTLRSRSASNRDPITAAAFNVRLPGVPRRSMRADMVACTVAGTVTSVESARHTYAPRSPSRTLRSARSRTISSAKNGFPAARSTICGASPATDVCEPSNSAINAVVCESSSGARVIVSNPACGSSAPRYSGRWVTKTTARVWRRTATTSPNMASLTGSIQCTSSIT